MKENKNDILNDVKYELLKFDPITFAEKYLNVDGKLLKFSGTGWKFLADLYRYIAFSALRKDCKPVVCAKGRQIGMTTLATAIELYFTTCELYGYCPEYPPIRLLHCFPALKQVNTFAKDKLSTMMRTSKDNYVGRHALAFDDRTGKKRIDLPDDTQTEKLFKNENRLWIDSNGNNAARLQGMTLDGILFDEVQRMQEDDIGNSLRTLTAAKYGKIGNGVQLYFGTPLNKGSYFWKLWQASDQRYYHLGCTNCSNFFLLYTPGSDEWEKIWIHDNIVECPRCHHQQEKIGAVENGKWIPTKKTMDNGEAPPYVGFHINQFLIPNFTKETIQSENPRINPTKSERIWQTEILGEFYSGSAIPITEEEIYKHCKNSERSCSVRLPKNTNITTVMGIDWGGKDDHEGSTTGQSYSAIVVSSFGADNVLQIENAFRLKKNDLDYKKSIVAEMFRRFNIKMVVADLGFGNDIVPDLQKEYGGRILGCINSASLTKPLKYHQDELYIVCNKDLVLDDLFNLMRRGRIKFPLKDSASFEQMNWLIEHCTSMELSTKTVQGNIINKYIKGHTPNDGLMALLYSSIAMRFINTKGFNNKENKPTKVNSPIIAYLPRF